MVTERTRGAGRLFPWPGVLALGLALGACGPRGPDALYADYHERVARTLSLPAPPVPPPRALAPPRPAQLRVPVSAGTIATLDFLALRGCALQDNVARRNSALGRVAPPSQRLLLDLEFLRDTPACEARLRERGDAALAERLRAEVRRKRRGLATAIYNAVLASEEFQGFWSPAMDRADYPDRSSSLTLETLEQLAGLAHRWRRGDYAADDAHFERLLSRLARGDGGTLLRSLERSDAWLTATNGVLDAQLAAGELCPGDRRPQEARVLDTVLRKFFIGRIQPRAAALDLRRRRLMDAVAALESALEPLPTAYADWRERRQRALERFGAAPKRHVRLVQRVLEPCGLLPGAGLRSSAGTGA